MSHFLIIYIGSRINLKMRLNHAFSNLVILEGMDHEFILISVPLPPFNLIIINNNDQ